MNEPVDVDLETNRKAADETITDKAGHIQSDL